MQQETKSTSAEQKRVHQLNEVMDQTWDKSVSKSTCTGPRGFGGTKFARGTIISRFLHPCVDLSSSMTIFIFWSSMVKKAVSLYHKVTSDE